jgi:hypothetical protein
MLIGVGDTKPVVILLSPTEDSLYGDPANPAAETVFELEGTGFDIAASPEELVYTWEVTRILLDPDDPSSQIEEPQYFVAEGAKATFVAEGGGADGSAIAMYVICLTVTEPEGLSDTACTTHFPAWAGLFPWSQKTIGSPLAGGAKRVGFADFDVTATGAEISFNSDELHMVYQMAYGDFEMTVRVDDLGALSSTVQAGVMVRDGLLPTDAHVSLLATPNGTSFVRRKTPEGGTQSNVGTGGISGGPLWLRISRSGSSFLGTKSTDGTSWTILWSDDVVLADPVAVGFGGTAGVKSKTSLVTFRGANLDLPELCGNGVVDPGEACDDSGDCCTSTCKHVVAGTPCGDDVDPCLDYHCTAAGACSASAAEGGCDDGDPCTAVDSCVNGECVGVLDACTPCPTDADVNDDNLVNVVDATCTILVSVWVLTGSEGSTPSCISGGPLKADRNCSGVPDVVDVTMSIQAALGYALDPQLDLDANGCPDACQ